MIDPDALTKEVEYDYDLYDRRLAKRVDDGKEKRSGKEKGRKTGQDSLIGLWNTPASGGRQPAESFDELNAFSATQSPTVLDEPSCKPHTQYSETQPMPTTRSTRHKPKPRSTKNRLGLLWLFGWLTLGGALLFHGLGGRVADIEPQAVASVAKSDLSLEYHTKSIEDIVAGDIVLAANPKTGIIEPKRVLQAFKRITNHLRILKFTDSKGHTQEIKTTDEHPFWVIGKKEFVNAGDLKVGDKVTSPDGELQTVVSTLYEPHPKGYAVYNFEVEDYHTYYVRSHKDQDGRDTRPYVTRELEDERVHAVVRERGITRQ